MRNLIFKHDYSFPKHMKFHLLRNIWRNRKTIIQGIWSSLFPSQYIKNIAEKRLKICRTNTCGFHDKDGIMEKSIVKGSESCGHCGCVLKFKSHSLASACPMAELGHAGFWEAEMTEQQEDEFRSKTGIKNK